MLLVETWRCDVVLLLDVLYVERPPVLFLGLESKWAENSKKFICFPSSVELHTQTSIKLPASNLLKFHRRNYFFKCRFLLKLIWCKLDQSSLRPIDGKSRSATAPPVFSNLGKNIVIFKITTKLLHFPLIVLHNLIFWSMQVQSSPSTGIYSQVLGGPFYEKFLYSEAKYSPQKFVIPSPTHKIFL